MNSESIAVTVVSGFLGAGKTTLLNRIAQQPQHGRMAVIVNDFGELNIDAAIIAEVTDAVFSLQNGCICCTVQEDLLAQLVSLSQLRPRLDRIVIECSGVSDPQRIVQTLGYPQLKAHLHLDTVITLVDASGYGALEGEFARLSRAQVACADLVLLNKADLVSAAELQSLRATIGARTRVISTVQAQIPDALLLGERTPRNGFTPVPTPHHELFESWTWQATQALPAKALRDWLGQLPKDLFRLKGLVHLQGNEQPFWLQHVGNRSQFSLASGEHAQYSAQLVFIARRDSGLRETLEAQLQEMQEL
ncbi:GTP-binding protein [Pseudomonas sp. MF6772]|jgi:G3E family GTPase|uniref:CobW family GTP-binding protein n=1 Tax=Pseudomonas TaxID=286 RepID=UPI0007093C15|nr:MULTISPECIES: GTP-binding protein [Pseudomonas]MBJ2269254.1 GTP-binding protein [Pseudomonas sp. MF6772]MBL7229610.1 GTP-binding protein [Pseudomonas sp.]MCU0212963.1 GTP-binding protein [Pseudomonas shahriarae]NMY22628.1 GTP-binding protein [Pseudomonas sp. WS 5410]